jgi:hypothetical protein
MPWAALLVLLAEPIIKKILLVLGIGIITTAGASLAISGIVSSISSNLAGTPQAVLQIATLYGFPQALGILLGGITTAASLTAFKKFGVL